MTSGFTGTLSIRDDSGVQVGTATVAFPAAGTIKCTATPTATALIPAGKYLHELTVVRASDSATIVCVGAGDSKFYVKAKVS